MRATLVRTGFSALGVLAAVCALSSDVAATNQLTVPEINGSMIPAALGLVTAGVLMLRARRGSK